MQNKESRLIQAAKRTVRAEATLVIIIIVIATWSTYALYKLSVGADSIFGFTFSKSSSSPSNQEQAQASNLSGYLNLQHLANSDATSDKSRSSLNQSLQDSEIRYRNHLIQELLEGQRELQANLGQAFPSSVSFSASGRQPVTPASQNYIDKVNADNLRVLAGYMSANNLLKSNQPSSNPTNPWLNQIYYSNHTDSAKLREEKPGVSPTFNPVATLNQHYSRFQPVDLPRETSSNKDEDTSNDREVAESSRDPSESIIESNTSSSDYDNPNSSPGNQSDSNSSDESSMNDSDEDSYNAESNPQESEPNGSSETSDQSSETEDPPAADEENAKDDSHSIDEEVDRMTQPSSGVASQQDRPFDYKNTVQFDDTLTTNNNSIDLPAKVIPPGNLIARFASPARVVAPKNEALNSSKGRGASIDARDLEVDHNSPISLNNLGNYSHGEKSESKNHTKQVREKFKIGRINNNKQVEQETSASLPIDTDEEVGTQESFDSIKSLSKIRQKRSVSRQKDKIREHHEVDSFLNSIDFDSFVDMPSSDSIVMIKMNDSSKNEAGKPILKGSTTNQVYPLELQVKENTGTIIGETDTEPSESGINYHRQPLHNSNYSSPSLAYYTSNDTPLRELLNQKRLLDELKQSKLPPPIYRNYTYTTNEPKTSGSLNHIDINQLLSAAASSDDDDHHHSKMKKKSSYLLKKKKQHDHMDAKKKSSSGFKKGGHKEKKQKKEEKKYLKEKRFKGAKKGKKVSKGKGGAGGKKGKKLYKDRGYKKKGFKNVAHKEEWGHKKSYFDEFRDKDFKKKWKKFDDKYNYAQMKKFQAKDEKGAKRLKHHDEKFKKYDNGRWKDSYQKHSKERKESSKKDNKHKKKSNDDFD